MRRAIVIHAKENTCLGRGSSSEGRCLCIRLWREHWTVHKDGGSIRGCPALEIIVRKVPYKVDIENNSFSKYHLSYPDNTSTWMSSKTICTIVYTQRPQLLPVSPPFWVAQAAMCFFLSDRVIIWRYYNFCNDQILPGEKRYTDVYQYFSVCYAFLEFWPTLFSNWLHILAVKITWKFVSWISDHTH